MGVKVVLAPRNSAEAVALGVSACFLAVAGFVATGDGVSVRPSTDTIVASPASATIERPRTFSRPPTASQVYGARVVETDPPLVMLPLGQQARAKLEAAGTVRGDGVTLVTVTRGQGVLALGGGHETGAVAVTTPAPVLIPTPPVAAPTTPPVTTPPPTTPPVTTPPVTTPPPTTPPVTTPPVTPTDPPTTPTDPPPTTTEPGSGSTGDGGGAGDTGDSGSTGSSGTDAGSTTSGSGLEGGTADTATADAAAASVPQG